MHSPPDSRIATLADERLTLLRLMGANVTGVCVEARTSRVQDGRPAENTLYFLPFMFHNRGGFYGLGPIDIERFDHPFRMICTYNGKECWVSARGRDYAVRAQAAPLEWDTLEEGIAWMQAGAPDDDT